MPPSSSPFSLGESESTSKIGKALASPVEPIVNPAIISNTVDNQAQQPTITNPDDKLISLANGNDGARPIDSNNLVIDQRYINQVNEIVMPLTVVLENCGKASTELNSNKILLDDRLFDKVEALSNVLREKATEQLASGKSFKTVQANLGSIAHDTVITLADITNTKLSTADKEKAIHQYANTARSFSAGQTTRASIATVADAMLGFVASLAHKVSSRVAAFVGITSAPTTKKPFCFFTNQEEAITAQQLKQAMVEEAKAFIKEKPTQADENSEALNAISAP